jgi:uncharacterized protein with PIN domain
MSKTKEAEGWLETLSKMDNNGIMAAILNIEMKIMLHESKKVECEEIIDTLKRIGVIKDSIERNDRYTQMEESKEYVRLLNNEIITIEAPQAQIPAPENIIQPLLEHYDKSMNVEIVKEEQDANKLHEEIKGMRSFLRIIQQRTIHIPKKVAKEKMHKGDDGKKKTQIKKKGKSQKPINYNDSSSDEFEKLEESEEEKGEEKEHHST